MLPIDGHNVQIMPSCDFQILVMPGDGKPKQKELFQGSRSILCFPKKEQFSRMNL